MSSSFKALWLCAVVGGILGVARSGREVRAAGKMSERKEQFCAGVQLVDLGNGMRGLVDAGGHVVPIRPFQRIAGASTIADDLLLHLAEPERIVGLTSYGREHHRSSFLYGTRFVFGGPSDLEVLKSKGVELIVTNHLGSPAELARAREAGIEVFNLGEMRGLLTLLPNIETVATLLGDRSRGARLAETLVRRMRAVAADIPKSARKRAAYVSAHGGQLFGGATRSSYHDVLTAAGLMDAAAEKYSDFPHYDPEQLLEMDPDIIVTQRSSVSMFCRISALRNLRACRNGGEGIVGMDDAALGDPSLGMLESAEELRDLVYGALR